MGNGATGGAGARQQPKKYTAPKAASASKSTRTPEQQRDQAHADLAAAVQSGDRARIEAAARNLTKAANAAEKAAVTVQSETRKPLTPILDAGQMSSGRTEPSAYMMRQLYGQSQLRAAVSRYSATAMKQMVSEVQSRHPGTKPASASSKAAMTDYIVNQIASEGDNLPTSGKDWSMKP